MEGYRRDRGTKRLALGLAASVVLHALLMLAFLRWGAEPVERLLHPLRFEVPLPEVSRFAPQRPGAPPAARMEKLESRDEPVAGEVDAAEALQPFETLELAVLAHALEGTPLPGAKADSFEGAADELPSLEEIQLEMARRRIEALQGYAGRWMADADTSDAQSQSRRRAEEVVDKAVAAMGGLEAMLKIKDKKVAQFVWDRGGPMRRPGWRKIGDTYYAEGRKFREELSGGFEQGFDGYQGWAYRHGVPRPAAEGLLRQRAERWDFLSRVKGEGVLLDYGGMRQFEGGRRGEGVVVEDVKYGMQTVVYFDPITHLPMVETGGGVRREMQHWQEDEGVKVPREIWVAAGRNLWRERFDVDLNAGLGHATFADPGGRQWDEAAMRILTQRPPKEEKPPTLRVEPVYQEYVLPGPGKIRLSAEDRLFFDFYLIEKLKAANLVDEDKPVYVVQPVVVDYVAVRDGELTRYEIRFRVEVRARASGEDTWGREIVHVWKNAGGLDDGVMDNLSSLFAEQVGWALLGPGVEIGSIEQELTVFDEPNNEERLDSQTRDLLRFYLGQKLKAAGLSVDEGRPAAFRAEVLVRGFYRAQIIAPGQGPMAPPEYTITLYLRLHRKGGRANEPMVQARIDHAWKETFPMDSGIADTITSRLAELIGAALRDGESAALQSLR